MTNNELDLIAGSGSVYYAGPFSFVQGETIALNGFAIEDKPFIVNHSR